MSEIVNKPWGREIILTEAGLPYTGKILEIDAGKKLSLQYHDQKTETLTLLSGEAQIVMGLDKENLKTETMTISEGYTIRPLTIHRIIAVTSAKILEVSTPESGTTFRLEDDYSRDNETDSIRNLPNRGWSQQ